MDRALSVFLLLLCGIAIGAGGVQMWRWADYTRALESERAAIGQRDELVRKLAQAEAARDQAQARARKERQAIYAQDQDAAAWARQPVPRAIAERVRRASGAADATSRATSSGDVPKPAG